MWLEVLSYASASERYLNVFVKAMLHIMFWAWHTIDLNQAILFANLDTSFYEMKFSGVTVDLVPLGIPSITESCCLNWLKDLGMKKCAILQPVVHIQLLSPNQVRYFNSLIHHR